MTDAVAVTANAPTVAVMHCARHAHQARGELPVEEPASKLMKLCLHFARKASVDHVRGTLFGVVVFPWGGRCRMQAGEAALHFECDAADAALLARTCNVIDQHVALFSKGQAAPPRWLGVP